MELCILRNYLRTSLRCADRSLKYYFSLVQFLSSHAHQDDYTALLLAAPMKRDNRNSFFVLRCAIFDHAWSPLVLSKLCRSSPTSVQLLSVLTSILTSSPESPTLRSAPFRSLYPSTCPVYMKSIPLLLAVRISCCITQFEPLIKTFCIVDAFENLLKCMVLQNFSIASSIFKFLQPPLHSHDNTSRLSSSRASFLRISHSVLSLVFHYISALVRNYRLLVTDYATIVSRKVYSIFRQLFSLPSFLKHLSDILYRNFYPKYTSNWIRPFNHSSTKCMQHKRLPCLSGMFHFAVLPHKLRSRALIFDNVTVLFCSSQLNHFSLHPPLTRPVRQTASKVLQFKICVWRPA